MNAKDKVIERQMREIMRLRAALGACAADYISAPCTVDQGRLLLSAEFRRRMEIAADALADELEQTD